MHQIAYESKPLAKRKLVSIYLRAANIKRAYMRAKYDVLEYLGELGGIREIVLLIASYFTGPIIKRLYYAAMVAKTFAIQHYNVDKTQYYASKSTNNELTEESSSKGSSDDQNLNVSSVGTSRNEDS